MSILDQAIETQLKNIEAKTGTSRDTLQTQLLQTGLTKHADLRTHAQSTFELGYGDANALVHFACASSGNFAAEGKSGDAVLDEIYAGPKAVLRSLHEALLTQILEIGEFEIAPKKGYVSLRRKKQFAMVGPATNTRVEVGINHKTLPGTERLVAQPTGGMCTHKIKLTDATEVDDELMGWIRSAYESAG
ncbi:DUF5655 domain-containing protein [Armatimonas sp.]|uniref:DUF5655 domain-containing protein n=1 Tax=Armatimonas sp. TaxID=1872638 RepID=UPI00286D59E1|nr:DUF5655 domain-containing protein [Armatimonas sp.]